MKDTAHRAIAIVGVGAILPDAPDAATFWENIKSGRYSISDVEATRWDPDLYYDADPKAPDKTYSRIGGWVRDWEWKPFDWKLPIPPKVSSYMDDAQRWGISITHSVLQDYGYSNRPLNKDRTAVIIGNAMAGEKHYLTALRVAFPEFARELGHAESFVELPLELRERIIAQTHERMNRLIPELTEDSMPGELSNVLAGRIANVFDFHGPNFVCDAACASALAAISAAVEGLAQHDFDTVITGGIDRNMGASTFVKFCKIGALSATGTRPYAAGADGFVMGEGASLFMMKRLADAEKDGDHVYAVLRGMGGSSDGKGKGITAPNPIGQKLAVQRGWENAGLSPSTATFIEGHGTSTRVGDVVEVESLSTIFTNDGAAPGSIALGSVKSNFGHLKGAAGSAGILKAVLALNDKVIPPSLNCEKPNPAIDFNQSPFYVNGELKEWEKPECGVRRAAVSAFGFGGTNFHAVFEEHIPGRLNGGGGKQHAVPASFDSSSSSQLPTTGMATGVTPKMPGRGVAMIAATSPSELVSRLRSLKIEAEANRVLTCQLPMNHELRAPERIVIDFGNPPDLSRKIDLALKAIERDDSNIWRAFNAQGIFRGRGEPQKVAFLFPGQGSQYINMLAELRESDALVRETFEQADRVMEPLLGKPLSEYIFVDPNDEKLIQQANIALMQTEITQPALITCDIALSRLLNTYGISADMAMGHSLGEYGALVQAGAMSFADALEAVAARGHEMKRVAADDKGKMAAVFSPLADVQKMLAGLDGYAVIANINSYQQSVIGGESATIEQAVERFTAEGVQAILLPVSHAFHTKIVAAASKPLRKVLSRMHLRAPGIPTICNVTGGFYPQGVDTVNDMLDLLASQVASPVQFIKGLETLYDEGARVFVEVGPKKSLKGLVDDVLGDKPDLVSLFTNHPKVGTDVSFNQALCGLYAAGHGAGREQPVAATVTTTSAPAVTPTPPATQAVTAAKPALSAAPAPAAEPAAAMIPYGELGQLFADFFQRGNQLMSGRPALADGNSSRIMVSGAALGLPGTRRLFDDQNVSKILHGEQLIDVIPYRYRQKMAGKHITRLVKPEGGDPVFVTIDDTKDVLKLAGRAGEFSIVNEFGVKEERAKAFDSTTAMAVAVGIDALRDAGIPLVLNYKTTTTGTRLPDRWHLPEAMRDDTGIIFASAFPGVDAFAEQMGDYYTEAGHREQLSGLQSLRDWFSHQGNGHSAGIDELDRRIAELKSEIGQTEYHFDRRFLFRILSMGHSQFAEEIGARGPNTQINGACASTTQAVSIAEDWIRQGRCRRVIIVSADNVTSDNLVEWMGAGFLATGAAATDENVEDAATPFDRRRHGMIMGMGAAALVVENEDSVQERGLQPICEVLGSVAVNSAFHGTRLDIEHIAGVMEKLVSDVERRHGITREQMAPQMLFMSHETYTPARGGSASAEIHALRSVFGDQADKIVITNTKGFTGHAMAAGIEDVVAVKALETGIVPPVPNFREIDPELGALNLSTGGSYPVQYALRLGAGFGSQLGMTLTRRVPSPDGRRHSPNQLGFKYRIDNPATWDNWLRNVSGYDSADIEVTTRRLRVRDQGPVDPRSVMASTARVEQRPAPPSPAVATPAPRIKAKPLITETPAPTTIGTASVHATPPVEVGVPETVASEDSGDGVEQRIIQLVADKTDYPPDMLDLDLDLEADLGVDTVKQAEVFAEVRAVYDIPRDDNLQLREFPTLAHVVQFVRDRAPDLPQVAPAVTSVEATPEASVPADTGDGVEQRIIQLVADKTDYPPDMLELDLDLEADLGVDTVKQAEVFAEVRAVYDIPRDDNLQLREFPTLAHVVQFVRDRAPDLPQVAPAVTSVEAAPEASVPADTGDGVEQRIIQLVADKTDYPPDMLELDLDLEADLGVDTVKQAEVFAEVRAVYDIPRDDNLQLREFPTLAHVVQFVRDRAPDLPQVAPAVTSVEAAPEASVPADTGDGVEQRIIQLVADKTDYPPDMLELDLDLEADLGVDTVKQAEVFAEVRAVYDIPRDDNLQLREFPTLAHVVQFVRDRAPDLPGSPADTETAAVSETDSEVEPADTTPPAKGEEAIRGTVLKVVAGMTGYPAEMLDMELDLEADLGIDTVKQAEIFAALREAYDIPRDETLQLKDFPTLNHAVGFVRDRIPSIHASDEQEELPGDKVETITTQATPVDETLTGIEAANQVPRRVPTAYWRPSLDLFSRTTAMLAEGSRVAVMPDSGGVAKALIRRLGKLGIEVLTMDPESDGESLQARLEEWLADGPINGVYWLPALDAHAPIADLGHDAWCEATHLRVKLLYTTMRALYEQVQGHGNFLVAATRQGGKHGYDESGAQNPIGGGVSGFVKAYKRERPDVLCKVIDFATSRKTAALAERIMDETLYDPGVVEVGYQDAQRWAIGIDIVPCDEQPSGIVLDEQTVFLITGAAGSIVSAIIADLASASGGTFHLLDLTPEPDRDDPDIAQFASDKEGLKREIFQRIKSSGERATPAMVEKKLAELERAQAALTAIEAVEKAGGTAIYHCVDLTDDAAICTVVDEIRDNHGKLDVLMHAGGLEISRFLTDKPIEEFNLVFDVKCNGWHSLLAAIGDMPLGAAVVFSSVAGRFGNAGQTDYSAANDLLCKSISALRKTRPDTLGIAIDWTAWGGIGMATRGSIPTMMAAAGIDMLAPEAGIPTLRRELTHGPAAGEIVVAGRLGVLGEEFAEDGGLDRGAPARVAHGPMLGQITGMGLYTGLSVETELDPTVQAFLHDHKIDGTPVLPGVMGLEAFAELATLLLPDWHVDAIEDIQFLEPFKFYRENPRIIRLTAQFKQAGEQMVAQCALIGERQLKGQADPVVSTAFKANVRLGRGIPEPLQGMKVSTAVGPTLEAEDVYRVYFHGPAYQVLASAWGDGPGTIIGRMADTLPANHQPEDLPTRFAPRLIELCFQTAGMYELGIENRFGLPSRISRVQRFKDISPEFMPYHSIVRQSQNGHGFDAQIVDGNGDICLRLDNYRTAELPGAVKGLQTDPIKAVFQMS